MSEFRPRYYKLVGREVIGIDDVVEWSLWMASVGRHVGDDTIDVFRVSTIFLGVDLYAGRRDGPEP